MPKNRRENRRQIDRTKTVANINEALMTNGCVMKVKSHGHFTYVLLYVVHELGGMRGHEWFNFVLLSFQLLVTVIMNVIFSSHIL